MDLIVDFAAAGGGMFASFGGSASSSSSVGVEEVDNQRGILFACPAAAAAAEVR